MTAAYYVAAAFVVAVLLFAAWVDYRAAERLRAAREQRDLALSEAARQAVIADTWRAIAEGRDVLAKVERGAM